MPERFSNNATTTLSSTITAGATTIPVVNGGASAGFPTTGQFRVLVDSEIMLVTGGFGTNSWTVATRGTVEPVAGVQAAATHSAGATVAHVLTAGALASSFNTGTFPGDLTMFGIGNFKGSGATLGVSNFLVQATSIVTNVANTSGGFNLSYPVAFPNGINSVVVTPGDNTSNFAFCTPVIGNCTNAIWNGIAFAAVGSAISLVPNGNPIRANVIAIGY